MYDMVKIDTIVFEIVRAFKTAPRIFSCLKYPRSDRANASNVIKVNCKNSMAKYNM